MGDSKKEPKGKVWCLMGPTAVGKTALSLRLADECPLAIISVDSAMVYRGMDIGTGKPPPDVLKKFPHALVDIRDPFDPYSAGDFLRDVAVAIERAFLEKKIPFLVGGTMLYFRLLQNGLDELPVRNEVFRSQLQLEAAQLGWPALHGRLAMLAPERAQRIHPNDAQRIQRALEILQGKKYENQHKNIQGSTEALSKRYDFQWYALMPSDRLILHQRIAERVEEMWEAGFSEEVQTLKSHPGFDPEAPSMRSVGYRQLISGADELASPETLKTLVIAATRQLAKRQLTWLRSWSGLNRIRMEDDHAMQHIQKAVNQPS